MTLSKHIKTNAPGWNLTRLAERLGYSKEGLRLMWYQNPERIDLWIKGLQQEGCPQHKGVV